MEKTVTGLQVVLAIVLTMCGIYLLISIYDSNKERKLRHESMCKQLNDMGDIYTLTKKGIESGELKVAVITSEGILFSKETKPKTKKHGHK